MSFKSSTQSTEPLKTSNLSAQTEEDKGHDFEKFIVNRFHSDCYRLMHWRNDKLTERNYVVSGLAPDLIYEYRNRSKTIGFAVECVWRGCYVNDSIEWAKDYQIKSYYDFQFREDMDVFVMIGIGDLPSAPAELYIVPLNHIPPHNTSIHFDFLKQYKRYSADKMFFLDAESMLIK